MDQVSAKKLLAKHSAILGKLRDFDGIDGGRIRNLSTICNWTADALKAISQKRRLSVTPLDQADQLGQSQHVLNIDPDANVTLDRLMQARSYSTGQPVLGELINILERVNPADARALKAFYDDYSSHVKKNIGFSQRGLLSIRCDDFNELKGIQENLTARGIVGTEIFTFTNQDGTKSNTLYIPKHYVKEEDGFYKLALPDDAPGPGNMNSFNNFLGDSQGDHLLLGTTRAGKSAICIDAEKIKPRADGVPKLIELSSPSGAVSPYAAKPQSERDCLFKFHQVHQQLFERDKKQLFGAFVRTKIDGGMSLDNLVEHAMKSNNRSREAMVTLGWMDKHGGVSPFAPDAVKQIEAKINAGNRQNPSDEPPSEPHSTPKGP